MNRFCHQIHTCHISVFVFLYFWVSLLERIRIRSPVQIYCLLFGWFQTGSEKKVDFSSFILSVLETLETFLVCLPSSSITRLCPQSNAVISCAWTCLSVPHDRQKRHFRRAVLWCFNTLPPRKHHSGIFPLCWSPLHMKNLSPSCFLHGTLVLHSVTRFSSESGTDTLRLQRCLQSPWVDLALSATSPAPS